MALFCVGALVAWRNLPAEVRLVHPELLLVPAGLLVPATVALNAARFALAGAMLGRAVGAGTALQVSLLASAANLLPLPGAALVRVEGLKRMGEGYLGATQANLVLAATGVGLTGAIAGAAQLAAGGRTLGLALCLAGAVGFAAAGWLFARVAPSRLGLVLPILAVELAVVASLTLRMWVAIRVLGLDADLGQALVITLAPTLASAVGILPDGLGLREAAAAGLASLVALPATVGYLAAALDRLVALSVMAAIGLWVARRERGSREARGTP